MRSLADAEDDELGRLVRGEAHPRDELAGEDDGRRVELLRGVDEGRTGGLARAELTVVHLRQQEGRDGAPHLSAQALGVVLVPRELEALLQAPLDEDDAATLGDVGGKLPSPLSVREPSM
jgi:hypothetical protein